MLTRFDKAGAAAIGAALASMLGVLIPDLGVEMQTAVGVVVAGVLTWLVPNKA